MSEMTADTLSLAPARSDSWTRTRPRPGLEDRLARYAWPLRQLGDGLAALASATGLTADARLPSVPASVLTGSGEAIEHWLDWAAQRLALEVEEVEAGVSDLGSLLAVAFPAIIRVRLAREPQFVLVVGRRGADLVVLTPEQRRRRLPIAVLERQLTAPYAAPLQREIDKLLDVAGVATARRPTVSAAMTRTRLGATPVDGIWLLRRPPSASFVDQIRALRIPLRLAGVIALMVALYGSEIFAWGIIGGSILAGRLDFGALAAWSLLLVSMVPLRAAAGWLNAKMATDFGSLLKGRLLAGALRLDPEVTRRQGAGHLLARVMESHSFEALAIAGGPSALVAVIELGFAFWLLASGAGAALLVAFLALWTALTIGLGIRFFRRLRVWTSKRLDLTHDLIERMVGHRTILAQERAAHRDDLGRDMSGYLAGSIGVDRAALPFVAGMPAGWLVLAIAAFLFATVPSPLEPTLLATTLGGILFAGRALGSVTASLAALGRAMIAWREIAPMFEAAVDVEPAPPFLAPTALRQVDAGVGPLMEAAGVSFSFGVRPVLSAANLTIESGERLLLEGSSGGGKSTLASLLVGIRTPQSGQVLLRGHDRRTLGASWHQFVTEAPQFHENHILSGSLGFNLLLGRRWPATPEDLAEARQICDELGLGDLIDGMPGGLNQMVGETGWQLSHGERSRIFLARALLQDAELTILDESFAALDPESLRLCLDCAFRRARTLLVIAHP